ncbi:hypothetical protein KUTeg_008971, partial [Tegillarca granosa]
MEGEEQKKKHRMRHAGPKAEKKKAKNKHQQELTDRQRNPKAFSIQHVNKTTKIIQRSQDLKAKKHHIPIVDRTPLEPPPVVVAIVGPPKVGKQKLTNIQGPVTVVSGKHRRLTIIECNNDINAMIDVAKVADLALLLVDASFGFEMETFEFLNICQVHGFPRIMGVLTHLDTFRDNKRIRKTKKRLKHRFWTEVYQGSKLFYLSGMVNGEYQKTEVHNLCRFISVMKFRPLQWRITHPYIVVDRMEDITDPEQIRRSKKCDRNVSLYGYYLPDPCPSPDMEKKRSLNQKERMIYAPMSGVGGIVYDKDAESKPANEFVTSLMSVNNPLDQKMTSSKMTLFSDTAPSVDEKESSRADNKRISNIVPQTINTQDKSKIKEKVTKNKRLDQSKNKDNSDSDSENDSESERDSDSQSDESESEMMETDLGQQEKIFSHSEPSKRFKNKGFLKWKSNLAENANEEKNEDNQDADDELGGLFKVLKHKKDSASTNRYLVNKTDCSKFVVDNIRDWQLEEVQELIKDCFVTGQWDKSEDAAARLQQDDELYGDFEDLETGEVHTGDNEDGSGSDDNDDEDIDDKTTSGDDGERKKTKAEMTATERRNEKKRKMKEMFDSEYDMKGDTEFYDAWKLEAEQQAKLNRAEFENLDDDVRVQYEGFRPGMYVRVEINNMPCEF